jgi:uncharacterized membrane protein
MENMSNEKTALGLDPNVGALICYLGNLVCFLGLIYSIVVVATDKTNRLTRFHAFQSILLSVAGVAIGFLYSFASGFLGIILGDLAILLLPISFIVFAVIGIGIFIFTILAAIKGFQGEMYKIPVIGNFAEQFAG